MEKYDHIIVGQGIAGSVLATQLLRQKKKVLVIDSPALPSSSKVAAGIWNPVVFKRLTKSWMADELLPELFSFYIEAGKRSGNAFLHPRNIAKQFTEEQEKTFWLKKSAGEMRNYLDELIYNSHSVSGNDYALVLNSGNLDMLKFLESTKQLLQQQHALLQEKFEHDLLTIKNGSVQYKNAEATSIIFCEGYNCIHNPYFNWVPFKPAKGEVLTIKCAGLNLQQIINKGIFILPLGKDLYKVGATYEWEELNGSATEKAKLELVEKLEKVISLPYTITSHESGIRPSTIDRRPIIGNHPEFPVLKIFNGMGTKAVMLAPYFAKHFINFMENKEAIGPEANVDRFKKYYKTVSGN
ncbi:MAG: NAD(P)/FAD-dependent oxidoreductase [Bacteroidia bacterium]